MREYAAAPAKSAPIAPASCRSHRYWRGLVELHDYLERERCWRLTDVGVCLAQTDQDIGLCDPHLEEMRTW